MDKVLPEKIPAKKKSKKNNIITLKEDIDRVGNISQKELALNKAGATRELKARVIRKLLEAKKEVLKRTVDGVEEREMVDDLVLQAKGVELLSKELGDSKELEKAVGSVTHNTVIYQWKDSPAVVQNNVLSVEGGR